MLGVLTETELTESLMEDAVVDPVEPGLTRGTLGGLGVASWSDLRTCGGVVGGDRRIMLSAGCSPREGGGGGASSSLLNLRSAWRWPWSAPSAAAGAPYEESMAALQFDRGRPFPSCWRSPGRAQTSQLSSEMTRNSACGAPRSLAGPAKIHSRCEAVGTPLRANSFQTGRAKKVNVASSFSPSLGALVSRPGAADPRAGTGSQFPAVLRVESKLKLASSS